MKKLLVLAALLLTVRCASADPLEPFAFVHQQTQQDGDTITTTQVSCSCTSGCVGGPTVLSASQTGNLTSQNKTNRRRTFTNTSGFDVYIGTAAVGYVLNTNGFKIDPSTGTAHVYSTYNTAAFYCQSVGASSATVDVIQESNSVQ